MLLLSHTVVAPRGFTLLCQALGLRLVEAAGPLLATALSRDTLRQDLVKAAGQARQDALTEVETGSRGTRLSPAMSPRANRSASSRSTAAASSTQTNATATTSATSSCGAPPSSSRAPHATRISWRVSAATSSPSSCTTPTSPPRNSSSTASSRDRFRTSPRNDQPGRRDRRRHHNHRRPRRSSPNGRRTHAREQARDPIRLRRACSRPLGTTGPCGEATRFRCRVAELLRLGGDE